MLYRDLETHFGRIDRRRTRYRFDLEKDLPWAEAHAPGLHLGPGFMTSVGIDVDGLREHPEAFELFQWSTGLEIAQAFAALEGYLLDFVDDELEPIGSTRSVLMLYQEERKHIALFERYAAIMRAAHPEWIADFEQAFAPYRPALLNPYNREVYPSATVQHYFFWLKTVFFEEYTLYLDARMNEEADVIQPLWRAAHAMHRREEVQHVVTDEAYLKALDIDDIERRACATAFWANFEETFNLFLGVAASRDLVRQRFPECAPYLPTLRTRDMPIFADLVTHPLFRRTREAAPGLERQAAARPGSPRHAGAALPPDPRHHLGAALDAVIETAPTKGITYIVEDDEIEETYGALKTRAEHALDALRRRGLAPGDPYVVFIDDAHTALPLIWAGLLGGQVPVPLGAHGPRAMPQTLQRLLGVLERLGPTAAVLVPDHSHALLQGALPPSRSVWSQAELLAHRAEAPVALDPPDRHALAFIQFSSGSTGAPKGVRLTHANLLDNARAIIAHRAGQADDCFVSWLPLFHDMGLIGYHLLPIVLGAKQVLMHPLHFARRPVTWLEAMDRHRATVTASPNFGLAHVLKRVPQDRLADFDLSSVHCLLNGAEPISPTTMKAFMSAFECAGFRPEAMAPAYGLAEGTLCVTGQPAGTLPVVNGLDRRHLKVGAAVRLTAVQASNALPCVSVGRPIPGVTVRIVDADERPLPDGHLGHVQVEGSNVTEGYYGDAAQTALALRERWLDTGDLGVFLNGALTITGRTKDVIFVNGTNVYAHDLEAIVAATPGVSPGRVAAFPDTHGQIDRVCVACTLAPDAPPDIEAQIRAAVASRLGVELHRLFIVPADALLRTTSGKIRRNDIAQALLTPISPSTGNAKAPPPQSRTSEVPPPDLVGTVRAAWAEALARPADSLGLDDRFTDLGGTSLRAAHIHALLEDALDRTIGHALLIDAATIREMTAYLRTAFPDLDSAPVVDETPPPSPRPAAPEPGSSIADGDIALVGMGLRLPGADSPQAFWRVLIEGEDRFQPVPRARWNHGQLTKTLSAEGHDTCPTGAFLDDVFGFDPAVFRLDAADAAAMNPQYRLFLEAALDAMGDGGIGAGRVGVFVSQGEAPTNFRSFLDDLDRDGLDVTAQLGNSTNNMVAAHLSRAFDLQGPAMVVQAACASSLVALHQARRSLQHRECEAAVVGGVELIHTPSLYALFAPSGVLSSAGACRPFSDHADGFVPGEGAAAVVLKRLDDAVAQGDAIYAVIKGSAVGNDGQVFSEMAPNPAGQTSVMVRALTEARTSPETIQMIEAHGTGTPVGDAVELRALREVYDARDGAPCPVTAVKSNVGHLLAAAGVAGIIKTALALHHGVVPPIAGFHAPDPRAPLAGSRLHPAARATPFPAGRGPRRAALNGLGIGGTNCHVILEQAPPSTLPSAPSPTLVTLGAHDGKGLQNLAASTLAYLQTHPIADLAAWCASTARRATPFKRRASFVVRGPADVKRGLKEIAASADPGHLPAGGLVFLFPGPGSQFVGMARGLRGAPAFEAAMARCDAIAVQRLGRPLSPALDTTPSVDRIDLSQPLVFAVSYATTCWLASLGVYPEAVIGHSAGELAALCAADAWPLETALEAIIQRGRAMAGAPPGGMTAVFTDDETLATHLRAHPAICLAADNAPGQKVVSGPFGALDEFEASLDNAQLSWTRLTVGCAAHSPAMAPVADALGRALSGVSLTAPKMTFFSSLTGQRETAPSVDHLVRQVEAPVSFRGAVSAALDAGYRHFVEVGPSAVLSPAVAAVAGARPLEIQCTAIHRRNAEEHSPVHALARLAERGQSLHNGLVNGGRTPGLPRPPYPYQRTAFPIPFAAEQMARVRQSSPTPGRPLTDAERVLFAQHAVDGRPIAPGAWMMAEVTRARRLPYALEHVIIGASCPADVAGIEVVATDTAIRLVSHRPEGATQTHLEGVFAIDDPPARLPVHVSARPVDAEEVPVARIYDALGRHGLVYGPAFRTLARVWRHERALWFALEPSAPIRDGHHLDPALLDGAFQALAAFVDELTPDGGPFLGFAVERLEQFAPLNRACRGHVQLEHGLAPGADSIRCHITLYDDADRPLLSLSNFAAKRRSPTRPPFFRVEWRATEPPPQAADVATGTLVIGDTAHDAAPIALALSRAPGAAVFGPFCPALSSPAARTALAQCTAAVALIDDPRAFHALAQQAGDWTQLLILTRSAAVAAMARAFDAELGSLSVRIIQGDPDLDPRTIMGALGRLSGPRYWRRTGTGWFTPRLRPASPLAQGPVPLRQGGIYWVFGGGSGIGLALGEAIARRTGGVLIVSGRRPRLAPTARAVLEAHAARVVYLPVDLADADAVHAAAETVMAKHGVIHGVIHSAGALDDGLLLGHAPAAAEPVLAPKLEGTSHLLASIGPHTLDFVGCVSSLSALLPSAGQAAYAAANAGMDTSALTVEGLPCRVFTLNYGPWGEVGMVATPTHRARLTAAGLPPLSTTVGVEAFFAALSSDERQLAVANVEPAQLGQFTDAPSMPARSTERRTPATRASGQAHAPIRQPNTSPPAPPGLDARQRSIKPAPPAPVKASAAALPAPSASLSDSRESGNDASLETVVRRALEARLRRPAEDLDIHLSFADLGVDSLMAVELVRSLESQLSVRLHPTLLFEHPTPAKLVRYLAAHTPTPAPPPPRPNQTASGHVAAFRVHSARPGLHAARITPASLDPHQVCIEPAAWGINFIDVLAAIGLHPMKRDAEFVPGHEVAGRVLAVGSAVTDLTAGDAVMALLPFGGYATQVVTTRRLVRRRPPHVDAVTAAAGLVTGMTAIACIEDAGAVAQGDRVLIQSAAGGTGSACVQLALHHGATVVGVTSRADKAARLATWGVAHPIDRSTRDFTDAVRATVGQVDVVIDTLAGQEITRALSLLADGGRFIEIGVGDAVGAVSLDPKSLFLRGQAFFGVNLGALMANEKRLNALLDRAARYLNQGVLRPVIDRTYPFEAVTEAHTRLRSRASVGKVVLVP